MGAPPQKKFQGFLFEGGGFSPPTNPDVIFYAHIFFREGGFVMFWGTPPPPPQNTPANWKTFSSVNMFVDYRYTYFDIGGQSITSANIAIYIL